MTHAACPSNTVSSLTASCLRLQGSTTIRVPVARYHATHSPLGPRPGAALPDTDQRARGATHSEAPSRPSKATAAVDEAERAGVLAPPGAHVAPCSRAGAVKCTTAAAAHPAPPLAPPGHAQPEHADDASGPAAGPSGPSSTEDVQPVRAHASPPSDIVRGTEDDNLQGAKFETLFSQRIKCMSKADVCSLAVRSLSWLYAGVDIDDWLLRHLSARDGPLQTARYRAVGLGNSSQSKCKGLAWLETTHPDLSKAVLASEEMMAARPCLKTRHGVGEKPPSEFLTVVKGGAFHNSGGMRPYMKVLKEAFVDVAIFHASRVQDAPPPPEFGMRMHQTSDASVDVTWSWDRVVHACPAEACPQTFAASCYLWAWLASRPAASGQPTSWFAFMRTQVLDSPHAVPVVVTTHLSDNISVRFSTTHRHARHRSAAARRGDTCTCTSARRTLAADALLEATDRPLKRARSSRNAVLANTYALSPCMECNQTACRT